MLRKFILIAFLMFCGKPVLANDLADILVAAKNNDVDAQMLLGGMYEAGLGVARNDAQCAYWWQRASDNGHVNATKALGSMYFGGRGVKQDYKKAMELYLKAAEQGHAHAIQYVAMGYQRGLGLPKDETKAAEWEAKAKQVSGPNSHVVFLEAYQGDRTETLTFEETFVEFMRQAEKGNTRGLFYVGVAYLAGTGTPQDYDKAIEWIGKAADKGLASAINDMGLIHQLGQGTDIDRVEAQKWYYIREGLEGTTGTSYGSNFLSKLNTKSMTEKELAQARKNADEWLKSHKELARAS